MKKSRKRFIENEYDFKSISIDDIKERIKKELFQSMKLLQKEYPHNGKSRISSTGGKRIDYNLYTGTGGNIYFYWRKYLLDKSEDNLKLFKETYETNLVMVKKDNNTSPSFFMSSAGIYALGCILAKEINDSTLFQNNLTILLKFDVFCTQDSEDELLYGTAGYLYSLLLVHTQCEKVFNVSLEKEIVKIVVLLINNGVNQMKHFGLTLLTYAFPKTHNNYSFYLGSAHGLIGVLYEILCAVYLFPKNLTQEHQSILLQSLKKVEKLQFDTGNFPTNLDEKKSDEKVHWCHGAVGAIHLFYLAYIIFKDKSYLNTAIKCGLSLWTRGILLKGNGVCHGISGTVYGLYKIYLITKEEEYVKKAFAMVQATYDPKIKAKVEEYEDPQRKVVGMPDTPYSLMEGMQGCLSLYCDLLSGNVSFPGYEII